MKRIAEFCAEFVSGKYYFPPDYPSAQMRAHIDNANTLAKNLIKGCNLNDLHSIKRKKSVLKRTIIISMYCVWDETR